MEYKFNFFAGEKTYINLSSNAINTINNDIYSFEKNEKKQKLSPFLNKIISVYCKKSSCSLRVFIKEKKDELNEITKKETKMISKDDFLIAAWNYHYNKNIVPIFTEKGEGITIRLHEDTLKLINSYSTVSLKTSTPNNSICNYDCVLGIYLKALLENYANLSYFEREAIYFNDVVEKINQAINEERELLVINSNGQSFRFKPYQIINEKALNHTYVVGVGAPWNDENEKNIPASFRITKLKNVELLEKNMLSNKEKKELIDAIRKKGTSFLIGDEISVKIRLTEKGIKMYQEQTFLRPFYEKIQNENEYIFNCTEYQIIAYFVKFGKYATVLEPTDLKDKFTKIYKAAYLTYSENN